MLERTIGKKKKETYPKKKEISVGRLYEHILMSSIIILYNNIVIIYAIIFFSIGGLTRLSLRGGVTRVTKCHKHTDRPLVRNQWYKAAMPKETPN